MRAYACMPLFSFSWLKPVASDSTPLCDSGEKEREEKEEREGGKNGREEMPVVQHTATFRVPLRRRKEFRTAE